MSAMQPPTAASTGPVGERRALVLRILRAARAPLGIAELAERLGLHPNTIRFHLDGLDTDGLVERSIEPTSTPGRPRVLYRATSEGVQAGPRDYAGLAAILAGVVATTADDPPEAARAAGRTWGRTVAGSTIPRPSGAAATRDLLAALDEMGFEPEAHPARRPTHVRIYNCPFRDVARTHQDIICALHLGLMQGILDGARDGIQVDHLQPDLNAGVCVARLARPTATPAARR